MEAYKKIFTYGDIDYTIETGVIAKQATGSVIVRAKDTAVMVTVVCTKEAKENCDFFPLTVNYCEKMYAVGQIPGSFIKREGKPNTHETLTARLIDRPLRPLFPKGFYNETQVVITVLSLDPEVPPEIPAMIGASAALGLSGAPFNGPIAGARVGFINDEYVLNPTLAQLEESKLDLTIAGTSDAVLMVESEASELPEDIMLGAVLFGHEQMQVAIQAIEELVKDCGKPKWEFTPKEENTDLISTVKNKAEKFIEEAYQIREKQDRGTKLKAIKNQLIEELVDEEKNITDKEIADIFATLEKNHVRQNIISGKPRIDGRDTRTVRPIHVDVGLFPRIHGSALFTRGETQAIVATTLGTDKDSQIIDSAQRKFRDTFMLDYNFPPYCVGETGMIGFPKRREIGHGNLAKRAIKAVLPSAEEFPYTLRVVSEITESNGSSSMATVCGSSLSLMDAGVPIKAPVAGIAMGLIKEDSKFAVLTDILGDEDHLGDMDFKVAGTEKGVTALQMDIKISGITKEIMSAALSQAKEGRMHILGIMNETITTNREELSRHAPRIHTIQIHPDKIRDVIGKGGATIRAITEESGATIDINDEGIVKIFAVEADAMDLATKRVKDITTDIIVDQIYEGKVVSLTDFGAFVKLPSGKDGLLHISQICEERVKDVKDYLEVGQEIKVKVIEIDRQGRIRLTKKGIEQ